MIQLSYSTINMVYEASHNWLNRLMGFKPEDHDYYHQGKEAHEIIQKHISNAQLHPDLGHLTEKIEGVEKPIYFPIVEQVDFDRNCKFDFKFSDKYNIIGFMDGHDPIRKRFLEIKSSSTLWTPGKFQNLMQRKIYALAKPDYTETICITCSKDIEVWKNEKPKMFRVPTTQRDRDEAKAWIEGGIKIIESGDYTGGLNEEGKCISPRCYFGVNCQFK